jgi:hypothetical protein
MKYMEGNIEKIRTDISDSMNERIIFFVGKYRED